MTKQGDMHNSNLIEMTVTKKGGYRLERSERNKGSRLDLDEESATSRVSSILNQYCLSFQEGHKIVLSNFTNYHIATLKQIRCLCFRAVSVYTL